MNILPSTQMLHTFEAAARLLNFTRTAEAVNLTQGAVSHQMRELEALLDVKLFERRARGLALTDAGRTYLPFPQEALERLRARRPVATTRSTRQGSNRDHVAEFCQ